LAIKGGRGEGGERGDVAVNDSCLQNSTVIDKGKRRKGGKGRKKVEWLVVKRVEGKGGGKGNGLVILVILSLLYPAQKGKEKGEGISKGLLEGRKKNVEKKFFFSLFTGSILSG